MGGAIWDLSTPIADVLPAGGRTLVLGCASESRLLADAVMDAGPALGAMTFTGIFVPGLNRCTYLANPAWVDEVRSGSYRRWIEQNYQGR